MTPTHLTSEITISVSPKIARTHQYLNDSDRGRLQAQVTSFLQSITIRRKNTTGELSQTIDDLGAEAAHNGLTPEILESILNEV